MEDFDPATEGWEVRELPGFADMVGPFWQRRTAEGISYAMLVTEKHKNLGGVAHGGVLATLLDTTLGLALFDAEPDRRHVTMSLDVQFLAPAQIGDFLIVDPEIVTAGRSVKFVRGIVRSQGKPCAAGQGVWKAVG